MKKVHTIRRTPELVEKAMERAKQYDESREGTTVDQTKFYISSNNGIPVFIDMFGSNLPFLAASKEDAEKIAENLPETSKNFFKATPR